MKGFTLVELVIVLAVFGILMLAGTTFFLQVIQNSNQAAVRGEVRQNASIILQRFRDSIRTSACATSVGSQTVSPGITVTTYQAANCTNPLDCYRFGTDGIVLWGQASGGVCTPTEQLSSSGVSVLDCPSGACGTSCTTSGAQVTRDLTSGAITVVLTVQQKIGVSRADQCGRIVLTDTITPRQY